MGQPTVTLESAMGEMDVPAAQLRDALQEWDHADNPVATSVSVTVFSDGAPDSDCHVAYDGDVSRLKDSRELVDRCESTLEPERSSVPYIRISNSNEYGCEIPITATFQIREKASSDDRAYTVYFHESDDVSNLDSWDTEMSEPGDRGFYVGGEFHEFALVTDHLHE